MPRGMNFARREHDKVPEVFFPRLCIHMTLSSSRSQGDAKTIAENG